MTFGTDQKRHLLRTFRGCWTHERPKNVGVWLRDEMQTVKFKSPAIKTVREYIDEHVKKPVHRILGIAGGGGLMTEHANSIHHLYLLLDRGAGGVKKLFAHTKRQRKGVEPIPDPADDKCALPEEGHLRTDWENLVANRRVTRCELYNYYFRGAMEVNVPPGKRIIIDGAPSSKIHVRDFDERHFSTVYQNATEKLHGNPAAPIMSSREILATPTVCAPTMRVIKGALDPAVYTHNIAEADLSVFFHINKHIPHANNPHCPPGETFMIDANDGDLLMNALLHSRDRIDPVTNRFNSRVWVFLPGDSRSVESHKRRAEEERKKIVTCETELKALDDNTDQKSKTVPLSQKEYAKQRNAILKRKEKAEADLKEILEDPVDGRDVYVNINKLYLLIDKHPQLSKAQYPQGMAVLLYVMSGSDFFDNFHGDEWGLFVNMNWEKHVWDTWCRHADRFRYMLLVTYYGPASYGQPELIRHPFIDEECMINFMYQCYGAKYGDTIRKSNPVAAAPGGKITVKMLEDYTRSFVNNCKRKANEADDAYEKRLKLAKRKRLPDRHVLCRYVRLAVYALGYMINDYRPGGSEAIDPLETYEGYPYYGFIRDPDNPSRLTLTDVVSLPKPVPAHYAEFVRGAATDTEPSASNGPSSLGTGEDNQQQRELQQQQQDEHERQLARKRERDEQEHQKAIKLAEREQRLRNLHKKQKRMQQRELAAATTTTTTGM